VTCTQSKSTYERIHVAAASPIAPNPKPISAAAGTHSSAHQDRTNPSATMVARKQAA
jgi:hypothetical protein